MILALFVLDLMIAIPSTIKATKEVRREHLKEKGKHMSVAETILMFAVGLIVQLIFIPIAWMWKFLKI
jgi:hypothetical protein